MTQGNSAEIITVDSWSSDFNRVLLVRIEHRSSDAVTVRLRYSASIVDRATEVCFFDHQETGLGPKKIQPPEIDLLSTISIRQSESQKASKV